MCFSRSLPDKAPSSCVPATRVPVWWDDVYNNGERQSNFTQHARHGSHLSARPLRHIWKEMRLKTTLTSCTGRRGERQSRATDEHQTQFHLDRALVKIKKYHTLLLCLFLVSSLFSVWLYFLPLGCHSHMQTHFHASGRTHTHIKKAQIDFFVSPDSFHLTRAHTHTHTNAHCKVLREWCETPDIFSRCLCFLFLFIACPCIQRQVKNVNWHLFTCLDIQHVLSGCLFWLRDKPTQAKHTPRWSPNYKK